MKPDGRLPLFSRANKQWCLFARLVNAAKRTTRGFLSRKPRARVQASRTACVIRRVTHKVRRGSRNKPNRTG
eukprot:6186899-Pleurochrysis_carterae.AAC.1